MPSYVRLCRVVVPIAVALMLPMTASAQTPRADQSVLASGTKVRFELRDGVAREAQVVSLGRDTLHAIQFGGSEVAYPVESIQKLEALNGRHRRVLRGVLIGTSIGVVVGGVAGAASYEPCESTEFLGCLLAPESRAEQAGIGAVLAGVSGLVIGGIVGLFPRDRWERISLDGRPVRVSARPLHHGAQGFGLSVAY